MDLPTKVEAATWDEVRDHLNAITRAIAQQTDPRWHALPQRWARPRRTIPSSPALRTTASYRVGRLISDPTVRIPDRPLPRANSRLRLGKLGDPTLAAQDYWRIAGGQELLPGTDAAAVTECHLGLAEEPTAPPVSIPPSPSRPPSGGGHLGVDEF